jgi:RHS repeat-associated protein
MNRPLTYSVQGYEPFGSLLPGRNYSSESYRFGFNRMEKDDEMIGATGTSYDFGARLYDPRVARWLSLDPLAEKYPSDSPYEFALSTPIQAVDSDGKVVVFINGNHFGDGGRAQYWRTYKRELAGYGQRGTHDFPIYRNVETYAFDKEVMQQFNDFKAIYRDGACGGWAPLNGMSAQGRRNEGYWQAGRDAKALLENLDAGETIKIVSHSMGGAYAKGYVSGLVAYMEEHNITDVKIELEVDFAPYQPDDHAHSAFGSQSPHEAGRGSVPTFQASHSEDGVAGNNPMRGAEQVDTSGDTKQGHSIFNFSSTVKKLGGILSKVREGKQ